MESSTATYGVCLLYTSHEWPECEAIIENLYPELERRLAKVKPDLLIARQGIKLKFLSLIHIFWMGELGFGPFLKKVREGELNNG